MAETNLEYIARNKAPGWAILLLKVMIMLSVGVGALWSSEGVWAAGSVGVGIMAWLNIIAIIIVQKPALLALKDYEAQKKAGLDPIFDPDKLGIANADLWREIGAKARAEGLGGAVNARAEAEPS
jgi:AGCS family alanine or glycine:cation symporter